MTEIVTIKTRKEFLASRKGKAIYGKSLLLVYHRPAERKYDENIIPVGITVTKKVGNAVTRNFVKRRLRHARNSMDWAVNKKGYNYFLIAKKECSKINFDALCQELKNMLDRIN